jgi:hypothetical protein
MTAFDFRKFVVDNWEDWSGLTTWLSSYGHPIKNHTVYAWHNRRQIPAAWFAIILALLEMEKGKPASMAPYMVDATPKVRGRLGRPRKEAI